MKSEPEVEIMANVRLLKWSDLTRLVLESIFSMQNPCGRCLYMLYYTFLKKDLDNKPTYGNLTQSLNMLNYMVH